MSKAHPTITEQINNLPKHLPKPDLSKRLDRALFAQGYPIYPGTIREFYKGYIHRQRDNHRCIQTDLLAPLVGDYSHALASEIANRLMQRLRKAKLTTFGYFNGIPTKQWGSDPMLLNILWDHLYKEGRNSLMKPTRTAKPAPKPKAYHVFAAGWSAHNAHLHGDRSRKSLDEAWTLFNKTNPHLTGDNHDR